MRELMRRLSFSDRVSDGSGGVPRGRELMRRLSFSDRVSNGSGGVPRGRELMRRLSFSDRVSDGSGGVPRGCVPVLVGDGCAERFVVRVEALRHPSFAALLDMAAQEFGYKQEGILRVPCAVHQFKQVLNAVSNN